MAMQFFKKAGPKTPLYLQDGTPITFETLDGRVGYFSTDNAAHIAGFEAAITGRRGGITKIDEAEFAREFTAKKNSSRPFVFPTEAQGLTGGLAQDTQSLRVPHVAASAGEEKIVSIDSGKGLEKPKVVPPRPVGRRPAIE